MAIFAQLYWELKKEGVLNMTPTQPDQTLEATATVPSMRTVGWSRSTVVAGMTVLPVAVPDLVVRRIMALAGAH